jgi:tartrate dehydratase alpha subunit/fumarate hydratase class I-like protein
LGGGGSSGKGRTDAATETKMTKMTKEAVVTTVATAGQQIDCSAGENVA